jgi:hypothetical protein
MCQFVSCTASNQTPKDDFMKAVNLAACSAEFTMATFSTILFYSISKNLLPFWAMKI